MAGSSAGRSQPAATPGCAIHAMYAEHRVKRGSHHREIDGEREDQPEIFSDDQLVAFDRLGEQAVDAPLLHFLRDEPDADEDRDEQAEDGGGGQPEVLDELYVLPGRELADQVRGAHQHDGEEHQVVEHLVANRFAEHVERDDPDRLVIACPPRPLRRARGRVPPVRAR